MIWIIHLNKSLCHIYSYVLEEHKLVFLNGIENPASRLKDQDLLSDRPGHYQTMHSARGAYQAQSDAIEVELDRFIRKIADFLKEALNTHCYTKSILFADSAVGGVLLKDLDKQVKKTLLVHIEKNFFKLGPDALQNYLKENWWDIIHSVKNK